MNAHEIAPNFVLPNPSVTWDRYVPDFERWKQNKDDAFDSEGAALFIFLHELMRSESLVTSHSEALNDIANALTEKATLNQHYVGELLYAFLALTITGDLHPARRFVAGFRLSPGLHLDYVKRTRCYG